MENNKDGRYTYIPFTTKCVATMINSETVWYANKWKNLFLKIKFFFYKSKNLKSFEKNINRKVKSSRYSKI